MKYSVVAVVLLTISLPWWSGCATSGTHELSSERDCIERLREDPAVLLEYIRAKPGSPEAMALRTFTQEAAGKRALLRTYLEEIARLETNVNEGLSTLGSVAADCWILFWVSGNRISYHSYGFSPFKFGGGGFSSPLRIEDQAVTMVMRLQEALVEAQCHGFVLPEYPTLEFSVLSRNEEETVRYVLPNWENWLEGHVLMVNKTGTFRPYSTTVSSELQEAGTIPIWKPVHVPVEELPCPGGQDNGTPVSK